MEPLPPLPRTAIFALAGGGLAGVAALGLMPLERLVPPGGAVPPRALFLVQPAVFVLLGVLIGCLLAHRVGLDAPLVRAWAERRSGLDVLRRQLVPALAAAAATALVLLAYGAGVEQWTAREGAAVLGRLQGLQPPLATKLLYGGIAEELLSRWGLMTLVVWLAASAGLRGAAPYWVGVAVAALLFARGHLPTLFLVAGAPPAWLVAAVVVGNAGPGALFGWLFWRHGLEAAMLAHDGAHLIAWTLAAVA